MRLLGLGSNWVDDLRTVGVKVRPEVVEHLVREYGPLLEWYQHPSAIATKEGRQ